MQIRIWIPNTACKASLSLGILTWYVSLAPVLAAEAADPAGDDHHERGGHGAHYQQQLQVDLAVLTSEPGVAAARHLYAATESNLATL
jgi:hypothetical protein